MSQTAKPHILLGVSGGIAAYKTPDLVRRLRERGMDVRAVVTHGAQAFVTPLSLQAVSGEPVHASLLDTQAEAAMGHIELARWADLVLIAPATAHILAKLAHGFADDLLTTLCLATEAPVVVVPAMNQQMWLAAATQANVATLESRGVSRLGPAQGDQACGEVGPGRMLEPIQIADAVQAALDTAPAIGLSPPARVSPAQASPAQASLAGVFYDSLAGVGVMVTAGPTREAIDPVRYISNHSSGKMGYAVAAAARDAGARVTLVTGPVAIPVPAGVDRVEVESAEELRTAVLERIEDNGIFISAAAVADYRPVDAATSKIKKVSAAMKLSLVRNPDVLAEVASHPSCPFTVGFAAETDAVRENAKRKLVGKGLDMIAANRVGGSAGGFDSDMNELTLFWRGGEAELGCGPKDALARELIEIVTERYRAKHTAESP